MDESVLVFATAVASLIGSPLIEGIKQFKLMVTGTPIEDKAALWLSAGVSFGLGLFVLILSGTFSTPLPADPMGWIKLVGGVVASIFAVSTVVFRQVIKPAKVKAKARLEQNG